MRDAQQRTTSAACSPSWWLLGLVAPLVVYPVFLMKVLCFALFACAFNLLIGYVGLLSFGHAMFFGIGGLHLAAHGRRSGAGRPELGDPAPAPAVAAALWGWWPAPSPSAARASTSP